MRVVSAQVREAAGVLRRGRGAARLQVGAALRRGAALDGRVRQRLRLLLALHDEVPLLPELAVELARRGRGQDDPRTDRDLPRARGEGQGRELEPRLADAVPAVHPRGGEAAP